MTTISSPPTEIQLHLLSFDAPGAIVADWLRVLLGDCLSGIGLWLLLEQMHRFDFEGPDATKIQSLITDDALSTYSLRGRLFWETGQIEWQRLSPDSLRVVVIAEGSIPFTAPDGLNPITETYALEANDSRLILWGTSRDGSKFYELRVAGSAPIDYPDHFLKSVAGRKGINYPVLPFRTYIDEEGVGHFRRFLPPTVCDEQSLRQSLSTDIKQDREVHDD